MSEYDSQSSYDDDPYDNPFEYLKTIFERDKETLEALTSSAEPLTIENLRRIDPRMGAIAEDVAQTAIQWPDEASAVKVADNSPIRTLSGEGGSQAFMRPILENGSWAYNNFFLRIGLKHEYPSEDVLVRYIEANEDLTVLSYGTKVYVERAHALVPEFMDALQTATASVGKMESWWEALALGHFDPDEYPDNRVLLDATRVAYVLLGQLMRKDDYTIQKSLLRMPTEGSYEITDLDEELRS